MATRDRYDNDILKTLKRIATACEKIEKNMREGRPDADDDNDKEVNDD